MKKSNLGLTVLLFSVWISPAMAYIDPGSGSAMMSAIIGFFVAISLAVKTYWYKLKAFLFGKKSAGLEEKVTPEEK